MSRSKLVYLMTMVCKCCYLLLTRSTPLGLGYAITCAHLKKTGSSDANSTFLGKQSHLNFRLTAFVLKSYAQARPYIFIDDKEILQSRKFLLSLQKPDGCFREVGMVHHKAMKVQYSSRLLFPTTFPADRQTIS